MDPFAISGELTRMKSVALRGATAVLPGGQSFQGMFADRLARGMNAAGAQSRAYDTTSTAATRDSSGTIGQMDQFLGKDDFLKLLVTQLRCQTVGDPVDQKELIAQMAQLSSLEEMQNMNEGLSSLLHSQLTFQAASLVGKTIVASNPDGTKIEGVVSEVRFNDGTPVLVVNDQEIPLGQVVSIK